MPTLWKIWWGHPECCDRDVREEVDQWAASNLIPMIILNDFCAVIDAYVDHGIIQHHIRHYKSIGQSILPDFFDKKRPGNDKKPKKKPKKPPEKKQKQTNLDDAMGGKPTDNPTDDKKPDKKSDPTNKNSDSTNDKHKSNSNKKNSNKKKVS